MKIDLNSLSKKYITASSIRAFLLFIPLVIIFVKQCAADEFDWSQYLDTSILISVLFAFLCESLASSIHYFIEKKYEDSTKLSVDYDKLVEKYSRENLIEYKNNKFPVICLVSRKKNSESFNIVVNHDNKSKRYELPKQIADQSDYLMKAHKHSKIFNNINVRLDDIRQDDGNVAISYSKTTYFDSLITNRAIDYKFENGKTIREIYEPGPFLNKLSESKLSNHLGFNGFVETSDGKFIFVLRGSNLSIGKNTLSDSIGASLKTKYCLDDDMNLTSKGIGNAICNEIYDELRVRVKNNNEMEKTIFAFYRDILEGGKPQFLFHYKLENMTQKQFEENFIKEIKAKKKELKKKAVIDGTKFVFLNYEELKKCDITAGKLVLPDKNTSFKILPSASAAIVMLLDYLG